MNTKLVVSVTCLMLIGVFFSSCSKDKLDDANHLGSKADSRNSVISNECVISTAFDIETISHVIPVDPISGDFLEGANDDLAGPDQVARIPKQVHCHVEKCIFPDGTSGMTIQMLPPNNPIEHPEGLIGTETIKAFDRVEMIGETATFYNEEGEVIGSNFIETDLALYSSILESLEDLTPLSEENMELVIQAMINEGMQVHNPEGKGVFFLTEEFADGTHSVVEFDKRRSIVRGQRDYDANGNLVTASRFVFGGGPNNPKLKRHEFTVTYTSPFSGVTMAIKQHSKVSNFTMTK